MTDEEALGLGALLLAAGNSFVAGIDAGVAARGFDDVRPAHGFAFARLAPAGATVSELAAHLGVTRQAAAQLVDELVAKGYVRRGPHPDDGRAQLVVLTERGWACTRAATEAAGDTVRNWGNTLSEKRLRTLGDGLAAIAPQGRLRPTW